MVRQGSVADKSYQTTSSNAGEEKQVGKQRNKLQAHMPFFWSKTQAADFKYKLLKCSDLTVRLLFKEQVDNTSEERILKKDRKSHKGEACTQHIVICY